MNDIQQVACKACGGNDGDAPCAYPSEGKAGCIRDVRLAQATGIEATLAERGTRYGAFTEHARITQNLKRAMTDSPNWARLGDDKKEALEMVAHKVGRILNGDPDYHDSWHDMIGYTKLVADTLDPAA